MSKKLLVTLNAVTRPVPGSEKEDGKPMPTQEIAAGTTFEPEDDDQREELLTLKAAREATKDEVTLYEERLKRRGEAPEVSTIVASTGGKARRGSKPKAEKAAGGQDGKDPLL